jgi:hypothetical protein
MAVASSMAVSSVVRFAGGGWQTLILYFLLPTVVFVLLYIWWFCRRPFLAKPPDPFKFHQVPTGRAVDLQEEAQGARDVSAHEAKIFATAIVKPEQLRRRIVEEYTPERRTLKKMAVVDVEIPRRLIGNGSKKNVYMPVVINDKGELLDDFHIYEANSDETQWLSYRQYLSLAAKVLHILLLTAEGLQIGGSLSENAKKAEHLALQGMVKRRDTRTGDDVDFSGATAIANLEVPNTTARNLAALFARQLTSKYPIVAVIGSVEQVRRHRFKYQLTLTPSVKLTTPDSGKRWSVRGYLQAIVGARPVTLNLDIGNAATCESYHLHVHAPDDLYLASQQPVGLGPILVRQADLAPTLPHCRFRRRLGQPHAHFYTRYMPRFESDEHPFIKLRFHEVPPGSVFRATITAVAALAILWLVGFVNSRFPDPDTDAPAFLLAFPALAATWMGFEAPSRKLLEGTLAARACLVFTAALSIAGAGLFMLHKSLAADNFQWIRVPDENSLLGVTDFGWAIVVGLALVNALCIGYQCLTRTWEYSYLMTKNVE